MVERIDKIDGVWHVDGRPVGEVMLRIVEHKEEPEDFDRLRAYATHMIMEEGEHADTFLSIMRLRSIQPSEDHETR
jgi:hypothetical protein